MPAVGQIPKLTSRELRRIAGDLRGQIEVLTTSYQEADSVVRDKAVLAEINRLRIGIKIILAADAFQREEVFPPKIEHGIPVPARQPRDSHPRPKWTILLRKMKPGDSVFVPANWAGGIITSAHRIGIRTSRQFIGQKVRIWRTS